MAPVPIQGVNVDKKVDHKYLMHINNKLDWTRNTKALNEVIHHLPEKASLVCGLCGVVGQEPEGHKLKQTQLNDLQSS